MNANELKAKARERLAEIAKQRAALDAEEREIRVMLGDVPPAPTVNPLREWERWVQPIAPMPYDVHPIGIDRYEWPYGVRITCGTTTDCAILPTVPPRLGDVLTMPLVANEEHALNHGVITSRTTGCAVPT